MKYNSKELVLIEEDLINTMKVGAKVSLRAAFCWHKEGVLSLKKLNNNIKHHILHGNSTLSTSEELNAYIYYSLNVKINNKENKWRNKNENKISYTNCR